MYSYINLSTFWSKQSYLSSPRLELPVDQQPVTSFWSHPMDKRMSPQSPLKKKVPPTRLNQEKETEEKDHQNWTCGGSGTGVAGGFSNAPVIKGRALILSHLSLSLHGISIKNPKNLSQRVWKREISSSCWWGTSRILIINSSPRYWHLTRPGDKLKASGRNVWEGKRWDFVPQGRVWFRLLRLNTEEKVDFIL